MKRNLLLCTLALLPLLAVLSPPAVASPNLTIDPLTVEQCAGPNCAASLPTVADPTILGGERDVRVDQIAGSGALRCWGADYPGLAIDNDPNDARSTILVAWDGPDGDEDSLDPTGLGGVDLLAGCGGDAHFLLDHMFADRDVAYQLAVYTDADNYSVWSSGVVTTTSQVFTIELDDLQPTGGSGADFTAVGAITLFIDASLEVATDVYLRALSFDCTPTAVTLLGFEAMPQEDAVLLSWETVSETDNLGFHLYRALKPEDGPAIPVRLNESLIPSQVPPGSPFGATYSWLDQEVQPGQAYYYWLEDVDTYGRSTPHLPPLEVALPDPPVVYRTFLPHLSSSSDAGR